MSPAEGQIAATCPHLTAFRARNGPNPFRFLNNCLRSPLQPDELPRCATCPPSSHSIRLYACLSCAAVSCSPHAAAHPHPLAVDVDRAELFCLACPDQVYDPDFDAALLLFSSFPSLPPSGKRSRVGYSPWATDPVEIALVEAGSTAMGGDVDPPWGLRGLNNLGNTCFMNSVLQTLLHAPPLRNYFLSDRHNCYYCQLKGGEAGAGAPRLCLACDLDAIFSVVSSGNRVPYSPAKLLYSWWQHTANLATYEQQDAHEFFISMLDGIHENVDRGRPKNQSQGWG